MAEPTIKNPEINKLADSLLPKDSLGRVKSILQDICSWCKKPIVEFRDKISEREYEISGFCQECQDEVFGK